MIMAAYISDNHYPARGRKPRLRAAPTWWRMGISDNHYPARGRKRDSVYGNSFTPSTISDNHYPARGRKLAVRASGNVSSIIDNISDNHYPARGRKPSRVTT